MPGVQKIRVTADEDNMRLDKWFFAHFPGLSNGEINKFLRKGYIRIDGKRAKNNDRLQAGQEIRVPPLDDDIASGEKQKTYKLSDNDISYIKDMVIYEDNDLIVLNKPAGLAVQGGTKSNHKNVDLLLNAYMQYTTGDSDEKAYLVHRLDKETSGLQILAKNRQSSQAMALQFKQKTIQKEYLALTRGVPHPLEGEIKAPLIKRHDKVYVDRSEGKKALTEYEVIDHHSKTIALVLAKPHTGRTHQIRVHLSHLATPIMGDHKYNENYLNDDDVFFDENVSNLFLHAHQITFTHPKNKCKMVLKAELPKHFFQLFSYFGFEISKL